ncbi:hydroxysteroid dehydrogenase-like protein 2 [Clavelina lepadiformis]|uniref:hydroxysteroid dehydrogenase-like protein 2 n=1 Tax=Clavelina lepadiformis TaxID=159417 RepID=UPI004041F57A
MINTGKLAGYTLFITGASRGIGKSIGLKAARDGANVVIAAKTADPHPKLPGTIYTAAKEIEDAGGKCLPCIVDVREESTVQTAVDEAVKTFGGIDILINNASAINLTGTQSTSMKKYDLMNQINARGTFLCSKLCLPHLLKSKENGKNPHIMNISPPLSLKPIWFKNHTAYSIAKYGMSLCVLGMAAEFEDKGISVNALWPKTAIITAAMEMLGGKDVSSQCRKPEIMADAAYAILQKDISYTGKFAIDDEVLAKEGITDFDQYAVDPGKPLILDFFLENSDTEFENQLQERAKAAQGGTNEVQAVFDAMQKAMSPSLVAKVNGIFNFKLSAGDSTESWIVDLKNGSGSITSGEGQADCVMGMTPDDFVAMFQGKLNSTTAFMQGKIKIDGNMMLAMKLEQLMKDMHKSKL